MDLVLLKELRSKLIIKNKGDKKTIPIEQVTISKTRFKNNSWFFIFGSLIKIIGWPNILQMSDEREY